MFRDGRCRGASTVPQSPTHLSVPCNLPWKHTADTLCCSSQSSAIPAPHRAGALFLGTCSHRRCPLTPWCSHSGASALAIHLRCSGPSRCPAPQPSQGSQPLMAQLCPSLVTILKPGPSLPPVLLALSQPQIPLHTEDTHDLYVQPA